MAEDNRNIFQRLSGLFRSNIVIRKTPQGQLKIKDLDMLRIDTRLSVIEVQVIEINEKLDKLID